MLKIKHKGKTWMSYLKGLTLISRLNLSVELDACFETIALLLHDCKVPCSTLSLDTSYFECFFLWLSFKHVGKCQDSTSN